MSNTNFVNKIIICCVIFLSTFGACPELVPKVRSRGDGLLPDVIPTEVEESVLIASPKANQKVMYIYCKRN